MRNIFFPINERENKKPAAAAGIGSSSSISIHSRAALKIGILAGSAIHMREERRYVYTQQV